jgi:hypothetical protein
MVSPRRKASYIEELVAEIKEEMKLLNSSPLDP